MTYPLHSFNQKNCLAVFQKLPFLVLTKFHQTCQAVSHFIEDHSDLIHCKCDHALRLEVNQLTGSKEEVLEAHVLQLHKKYRHVIRDVPVPLSDIKSAVFFQIQIYTEPEEYNPWEQLADLKLRCESLRIECDALLEEIWPWMKRHVEAFRIIGVGKCGPAFIQSLSNLCEEVTVDELSEPIEDYQILTRFSKVTILKYFFKQSEHLKKLTKNLTLKGSGKLVQLNIPVPKKPRAVNVLEGCKAIRIYEERTKPRILAEQTPTSSIYLLEITDRRNALIYVILALFELLLSENSSYKLYIRWPVPLDMSVLYERLKTRRTDQYLPIVNKFVQMVLKRWRS